uniref:separase n=1 Tax=Kwoniella pini CBS 10737 TaxID=1296096 RepID=A0A1B9I9B6_9TREE|nr:uncharacterized protein I206_01368 [Kwoniella pini CBS 10737]OCF52083.1 hypothetical protein I206_01368 [Kwoniella pini CBS 10737]
MPPKATTATKAVPPAPRKVRTTKTTTITATKDCADELVEGLGKLKIQPIPKRTIVKDSSSTLTTASSSKLPSTKRPVTSASAKKIPAPSSSTSGSKGKFKVTTVEDTLPWAKSECPEGEMKPLDRVRGAMQAINNASKDLSTAVSSGFKYTTSSQTPTPITNGKGKEKDTNQSETNEWTNEKVGKILDVCKIAFRVLRGLDEQGHLQNKGLDVERSSIGIVAKCISMGMFQIAMEMLVGSRPALLRLYDPRPNPILPKMNGTATPSSASASSLKSAAPRSHPSSYKSTSRVTAAVEGAPKEWLEMGRLPSSKDGGELSETLRSLLFSVMMATWICLLVLVKNKEKLLSTLAIPSNTSEEDLLHPLILASSIPIPQTTFYLHNFYRQVTNIATLPSTSYYLQLRHLSLLSMSITITPSSDSRTTPTQFWDTTHRTILQIVKEDDGKEKLREAAQTIDHIVGWVENLAKRRGEKFWFEGKGWLGLVEMWIGLGRRLGESEIIDRPLALLATPTSISSPPSTAGPTPVSRSSAKSSKIRNPEAEIARVCGDLAKASLQFEKASSPIDHSLNVGDLITLAYSITSLTVDGEFVDIAGKAIRAFERVRRGCLKDYKVANDSGSAGMEDVKEWLKGSIEFIEILINPLILDASLTRELLMSLTDTLIQYFKPSQYSSSYHYLQRARVLIDQTADITQAKDRADWLRCLSTIAYNGAGQSYRSNRTEEALSLTEISCTWGAETLRLMDGNQQEDKLFTGLREGMSKRWELLSGCHQRLGQKEEMFTAYSHVFASQSPQILSQIAESSRSKSVAEALAPHAELDNSLKRLVSLILYEPSLYLTHGRRLIHLMQEEAVPLGSIGAIAERLMGLLEEGEWKDDIVKVNLEIGDAVLELYGEEYPIRRIRVLSKMLRTILTSGQSMDRFDGLVEEANRLSIQGDHGQDVKLCSYKAEYVSYSLILRAMQSYHTSPHPSLDVLQATKEVVEKLRQIIIPPTSNNVVSTPEKGAPTRKTPLGSLSTLLGLLGHSLQQIEVLKLLRAFQRNKEDLVDGKSTQLATEYQKLGKTSRAGFVFTQAQRVIEQSKVLVSAKVRVESGLRFAAFLALKGDVSKAQEIYTAASVLESEIEENKTGPYVARVTDRCDHLERAAWARRAAAAIYVAQDDSTGAIMQLSASFRLLSRAADAICRIAASVPGPSTPADKAITEDDPFGAPLPPSAKPKVDGADEPSKDSKIAKTQLNQSTFNGKHLSAYQWNIACSLLNTILDLSNAFAYRGTVKECEYFLNLALGMAETVKSDVLQARIQSKQAELCFRMRKFEEMGEKLENANTALHAIEGPDMVDLHVLKGDLYSRTEMLEEAEQVFQSTSRDIEGLDRVFVANEAVLPTVRASLTNSKLGKGSEPLLPTALAHILRQYAWLLKEAGSKEECEELLAQIKNLPSSTETTAEQLLLEGRIALHEAFNTFKTDLFMSSLTESAVAMPMGAPAKRVADRQSTRQSIQTVLTRAEEAFLSALSLVSGSGKIEGLRQACLALALLRTFQTSLGNGSEEITASAAGMLASSSAITLQRELLEAIESKFVDIVNDDLTWPSLLTAPATPPESASMDVDDIERSIEVVTEDLDDHNGKLRAYWEKIKLKYSSNLIQTPDLKDLNILPPDWAVISINVTDDRNTMFISRHQRDHQPIVFCLPLDRQGRREGEDDESLFTFDSATTELQDIINSSNDSARTAKSVVTREDKLAWWEGRFKLDAKMKELCESIEFVWLGAFKTIFSPRLPDPTSSIADLKQRLTKIFDSALAATSGGASKPRSRASSVPTLPKVDLNDSLLACFVNLSSKCKDEEIEDLVYFILDVYQFHGIPVALSELDIDQISIDVKAALEKVESKIAFSGLTPSKDEHLFLALDKNIQPFPWESIPILRGRPISRIPSLSFLLDQVKMSNHLRPSLSQSTANPDRNGEIDVRRTVNSRKTFYILNPSGDLDRTEQHFKPYIDDMVKKAGWKGIIGRPPTELEMAAALKDYDLVLYFGHGGAEQYIRSHKIRHLPQCASTMLWGCSSGHLREQGDLDRTGTAWHYMVGGCPSLTANLWDVTDKDIDRLSSHVLKLLHLDSAHLPDSKSRTNTLLPLSNLSIVQAVNESREECKLKYLTGAAPVVYGLPVWLH